MSATGSTTTFLAATSVAVAAICVTVASRERQAAFTSAHGVLSTYGGDWDPAPLSKRAHRRTRTILEPPVDSGTANHPAQPWAERGAERH